MTASLPKSSGSLSWIDRRKTEEEEKDASRKGDYDAFCAAVEDVDKKYPGDTKRDPGEIIGRLLDAIQGDGDAEKDA